MARYEYEPGQLGTPQKRAALIAYVQTGTVSGAMRAVRMGRTSWYRWKSEDPQFAEAIADAEGAAADRLEEVAIKRAIAAKDPSDVLLIFLLKGMRPEKYRERYAHQLTGPNDTPLIPPGRLTDQEIRDHVNRIAALDARRN